MPNQGLLTIGDPSEGDHWRQHLNPTQSQAECFLTLSPARFAHEIGRVLSLARKKQLILLDDENDANGSGNRSAESLAKYDRIRTVCLRKSKFDAST